MTTFEKKISRRHWLAAAAGTTLAPHGWAQAYPDRPVKIIVPFAPGGPSDIVMRMVADKLQLSLKQPIFLENQSGAGGNIGASYVSRSAPDG